MTPQQRLQEAKDQAAREMARGNTWSDFRHYISMSHDDEESVYNRFGEIMFEAGKKEGYDQCDQEWRVGSKKGDQLETFRNALRDIAITYPLDSEARKLALEALYKTGKETIEQHISIYDEAINKAETYRKALEEINELSSCRPNNGDISAISHTALNSKP